MEIQEPPVYESKESYGMKGWFSSVFRFIKRRTAITTQTATYVVPDNIFHVRMDATAGARTVTLPAALSYEGRQILVTKIDSSANAVTVAAAGADTIQGAASVALAAQWSKVLVISNGTNGWDVVGTDYPILSKFTNSLGADVALNNTANYFDGPSVAQGTAGTWFVSGTVTLDSGAAERIYAKLWDGTTVIASAELLIDSLNAQRTISLSGYLVAPAGNLKISCRGTLRTDSKILFNITGNSKDSTISAIRVA